MTAVVEPAHAAEWSGEDVSVSELEQRLAGLEHDHGDETPDLRTSVMTHLAWVTPEWEEAALAALAGLAERHPSRTIVLFPDPGAAADRIDATLRMFCFCLPETSVHICSEVVELRLRGARAAMPASVVSPLLIADLPVFVRWRGRPAFGEAGFEGMVDLVDRLVIDSSEWPDLPDAYRPLAGLFDRTACSDIAWSRTEHWRAALAGLWPGIAELGEVRVKGPLADALLLAGWLRSRLRREVELVHEAAADRIEAIDVDGEAVAPPRAGTQGASDLLSAELDRFEREPVYEAAVRAAAS
jgi:glucose-6-phosphate dehydrogenase assembly protein OpcA